MALTGGAAGASVGPYSARHTKFPHEGGWRVSGWLNKDASLLKAVTPDGMSV